MLALRLGRSRTTRLGHWHRGYTSTGFGARSNLRRWSCVAALAVAVSATAPPLILTLATLALFTARAVLSPLVSARTPNLFEFCLFRWCCARSNLKRRNRSFSRHFRCWRSRGFS